MILLEQQGSRTYARWGRSLLWLLALGYLITIVFTFSQFYARAQGGLAPALMEFTPTYGASLQLRNLAPETLYERVAMVEHTRRTLPAMYPNINPIWLDRVAYAPWLYPPHFILLIVPLALLPYWWAYLFWVCASAVPYLVAMRNILPAHLAWPVALAAPPVFYNTLQGQTGFLTAGFIGLGLALIRQKPVLAGICIGLASVKPHFGLLIPIALVAGGYWRVVGATAVTILTMIIASVLAFGTAPWLAFLASASTNLQGFENSIYKFTPMTTVLSSLAMAGADLSVARAGQYASLLLMVAVVGWVWLRGAARPDTLGLQSAILCIATPLALPMTFIYDLVLIVPAIAWIGLDLQARAARNAEWWTLTGATAALLTVVTVAHSFKIQIGPMILAVLLILAIRRYLLALNRIGPLPDTPLLSAP